MKYAQSSTKGIFDYSVVIRHFAVVLHIVAISIPELLVMQPDSERSCSVKSSLEQCLSKELVLQRFERPGIMEVISRFTLL